MNSDVISKKSLKREAAGEDGGAKAKRRGALM